MKSITLPATIDSINNATDFINEVLEEADCPMRTKIQLDIALDELMSNVARYAYPQGEGDITVSVEILETPKRVVLTLIDSGIPYDPLKKDDPDVSLSAEEREIGGLGIYIVKESMDDLQYEYKNNQNIVTIVKRF